MTSERRLAANRRNAQRSTGPRTPAGIARASRNAIRHGLDARSPVIPALEDPAAWDAHLASTLVSLAPDGALQVTLAERAALLLWRLTRVARYERAVTAVAQEDAPERAALDELVPVPRGAAAGRGRLRALTLLPGLAPDDRVTRGTATGVIAAVADQVRKADNDFDPDTFLARFLRSEAIQLENPAEWTAGLVRRVVDAIAAQQRRDPATLLDDALDASRRDAAAERADARRVKRRAEHLRRERVLPTRDNLDTVIRYETHLNRQLDQTLAQLQRLQHPRRAPTDALPEHRPPHQEAPTADHPPAKEPAPPAAHRSLQARAPSGDHRPPTKPSLPATLRPHAQPSPRSGPLHPTAPPTPTPKHPVLGKQTQRPPGQRDPGTTGDHPSTTNDHP